jgi:hypothetical protein
MNRTPWEANGHYNSVVPALRLLAYAMRACSTGS